MITAADLFTLTDRQLGLLEAVGALLELRRKLAPRMRPAAVSASI